MHDFKNIMYVFEYQPEWQEVEDLIANIYAISPDCILIVEPGLDDETTLDDIDLMYPLDQFAVFHLYVDIVASDQDKLQSIEHSVREIVQPYLRVSI